MIICSTPIDYPPADSIWLIFIFHFSDMITQLCWFLISPVKTGSVLSHFKANNDGVKSKVSLLS